MHSNKTIINYNNNYYISAIAVYIELHTCPSCNSCSCMYNGSPQAGIYIVLVHKPQCHVTIIIIISHDEV